MNELERLKKQEQELKKRIKLAEEKELLKWGKLARKYSGRDTLEEAEKEFEMMYKDRESYIKEIDKLKDEITKLKQLKIPAKKT